MRFPSGSEGRGSGTDGGAVGRLLGAVRSVAGGVLRRIRSRVPGVLGRDRAAVAVGSAVEDVHGTDSGAPSGWTDGGLQVRQSTRSRGRSFENPAQFADPGSRDGGDHRGALPARDPPLADPADRGPDGLTTDARERADGRLRILDPEDPDAYVESDVRVRLDHVR